jgi:molybdenum cofactor guanylyltransferase
MSVKREHITAVIVAGGKGRRLGGQDKGLVRYQGKALIEHVLTRIKPQLDTIIINANRNQDVYARYGFPVISDEMRDFQGPLAGFASAMKFVSTDYILTLPCDGPSLPADLVERMLKQLNPCAAQTDCIAVAHDGIRIQPVYALIPVSLLESLENFLASGERKIDLWYAKHKNMLVDFSDNKVAFLNINYKEQLVIKANSQRHE